MDFGKVEYTCIKNGNSHPGTVEYLTLRLTLVGQGDDDILREGGISALRHKRIARIAKEAEQQGCLLSYEDLSTLLVTSISTLKRDIAVLQQQGIEIPLKGRRKNGVQKPENGHSVLSGEDWS